MTPLITTATTYIAIEMIRTLLPYYLDSSPYEIGAGGGLALVSWAPFNDDALLVASWVPVADLAAAIFGATA